MKNLSRLILESIKLEELDTHVDPRSNKEGWTVKVIDEDYKNVNESEDYSNKPTASDVDDIILKMIDCGKIDYLNRAINNSGDNAMLITYYLDEDGEGMRDHSFYTGEDNSIDELIISIEQALKYGKCEGAEKNVALTLNLIKDIRDGKLTYDNCCK